MIFEGGEHVEVDGSEVTFAITHLETILEFLSVSKEELSLL